MSECHGNRCGSQEFFHHREANCTHHQPTSKEMLPAWEGRQSENAEQFLLQKTHSVASTVILTTYSVSVKLLFMSTHGRNLTGMPCTASCPVSARAPYWPRPARSSSGRSRTFPARRRSDASQWAGSAWRRCTGCTTAVSRTPLPAAARPWYTSALLAVERIAFSRFHDATGTSTETDVSSSSYTCG